jgi:hypothetical protein
LSGVQLALRFNRFRAVKATLCQITEKVHCRLHLFASGENIPTTQRLAGGNDR